MLSAKRIGLMSDIEIERFAAGAHVVMQAAERFAELPLMLFRNLLQSLVLVFSDLGQPGASGQQFLGTVSQTTMESVTHWS